VDSFQEECQPIRFSDLILVIINHTWNKRLSHYADNSFSLKVLSSYEA
jgi:hypothetical protein